MNCQNEKCKSDFEPKTYNQKYCCIKCSLAQNQRRFRKRNAKPCPLCNALIKGTSKLCVKCTRQKEQYINQNMTLKEYMSLSSYRGHPSWLYNKIRALARYLYSDLQKKPCLRCKYSKHVQICHIKPIPSFSDNTQIKVINSPENIIQLCPNCHWELDNKLFSLSLLNGEWHFIEDSNL